MTSGSLFSGHNVLM